MTNAPVLYFFSGGPLFVGDIQVGLVSFGSVSNTMKEIVSHSVLITVIMFQHFLTFWLTYLQNISGLRSRCKLWNDIYMIFVFSVLTV